MLVKYSTAFYLQYLNSWPEYFMVAEDANGKIMGYSWFMRKKSFNILCSVMGKAEGSDEDWHGHGTFSLNTSSIIKRLYQF